MDPPYTAAFPGTCKPPVQFCTAASPALRPHIHTHQAVQELVLEAAGKEASQWEEHHAETPPCWCLAYLHGVEMSGEEVAGAPRRPATGGLASSLPIGGRSQAAGIGAAQHGRA